MELLSTNTYSAHKRQSKFDTESFETRKEILRNAHFDKNIQLSVIRTATASCEIQKIKLPSLVNCLAHSQFFSSLQIFK